MNSKQARFNTSQYVPRLVALRERIDSRSFLHSSIYEGDSLYSAASEGNLDAVKYMCSINIPARNYADQMNAALGIAAINGHMNVVRYLISVLGDDLDTRMNGSLIGMARNGRVNIITYLERNGINIQPNIDEMIDEAALEGHIQLVDYLFRHQASNWQHIADSSLMDAIQGGHTDVFLYLYNGLKQIYGNVLYFLNQRDHAFSLAAGLGRLDIVRFFWIMNNNEQFHPFDMETLVTALISAVYGQHAETVEFIIANFYVSPEDENRFGQSALDVARQQTDYEMERLMRSIWAHYY